MRITSVVLLGLILASSAADRTLRAAPPALPCSTAVAACTEWVAIKGGPARSMIYRTFSLDVRNEKIRRAMVMVHGTNRNADHYFTTATAAAFLGGALDDTVVISPRFTACQDT